MKLTIALQNEMMVESSPVGKGGNIVIDIPDECARDLWDAQIEFWLEDNKNGNKITDNGFLRMLKKKLKLDIERNFNLKTMVLSGKFGGKNDGYI